MTNTYLTNNPLGSNNFKDLSDNASNFDDAMNSPLPSFRDRYNQRRETWTGIEKMAADAIANIGFEATHLTYVVGTPLVVSRPTQLIDYNGTSYKVKQPASFPVTLTGVWATDQANLVDVGDLALRQALASPTGATMVFDGTRSVHDALLSAPFGVAAGDGVTDDAPRILEALNASSNIVLAPNPNGYVINSNVQKTLTQDTVIDFNGQQVRFDVARGIELASTKVATGLTLGGNLTRGDNVLVLNGTTGIQAGDLLFINTSIRPSSDWGDTKKDCVLIKNVDGLTVRTSDPLNFGYTTADAGLSITVYRPVKLTLRNANLLLNAADTDATPRVMIGVEGIQGLVIERPVIKGQIPFSRDSNIYRVGIQVLASRCVEINSPTYFAMSYQIGIYWGTRYIRESNVNSNYCHHGHADVGDWASDYRLDGLQSTDGYQSVSTHVCFRAYAENLDVINDLGLSCWRTVGGGLRDGIIRSSVNDLAELPQYQNAPMNAGYTDLYSDADFYCENVDFRMPARINQPGFGVRYGRTVMISNTRVNDIITSFGARGDVRNLIIGPGNRIGALEKPAPGSAYNMAPTRIDIDTPLDAYTTSGEYHVNPRLQMVPHSNGRLACRGSVFTRRAGASPLPTSLVLHVNAFSDASQVGVISGKIKLFATAYTTSAGFFSTQERHFNFMFYVPSTSSLYFPTTPVFTSGLSGQTGEGVAITLSAPSFAGVSQVGANGDNTITLPVSLTTPGTSPIFSLSYELELDRST